MSNITPKQQRFVDEYLIDLNATQAATRAGYSAKTAGQIGEKLLRKVEIQHALTARMKARETRTEITQDYVLSTIRNTVERCSQAEPVIGKDGEPTGEYKFDAAAVLKGCELLGKHLGTFRDKVELTGADGGPVVHTITRRIIDPAK